MKRLYLLIAMAAFTLFVPALAAASPYVSENKPAPAVGQQVIREGDYAVELTRSLKLGDHQGEADAENTLAVVGITPKSGWISDFPVTPDVIADIQVSIDAAADEGKLPMGRADSEMAFSALNNEIGIEVAAAPGDSEGYAEGEAPAEPTVIENYYYEEGPPVVTYYAPPPDYAYLYAWDPFPFWCGGFFFPGFFVLGDFDFAFFDEDHFRFHDRDDFRFYRNHEGAWRGHREVSNHVTDPVSKRIVAVDPVSKRPLSRTAFRPVGARNFDPVARTAGGHGQRLIGNAGGRGVGRINSGTFDRTSAANLLNRGTGRVGRATVGRNSSVPAFRRDSISGSRNAGPGRISGNSGSVQSGRITGAGRGVSRPSERQFNRTEMTRSRSFSEPVRQDRSFNRPARQFSAPTRSFSEPRGTVGGGYRGGAVSHSFNGGSRSMGAVGGRSFAGGGGHSFSGGGGGHSFSGGGHSGFGGGSRR